MAVREYYCRDCEELFTSDLDYKFEPIFCPECGDECPLFSEIEIESCNETYAKENK